jgi:hypothetical protein
MIIEAILKLNPTAQVSVSGDDINQITWENGTPPIPKEQILAILPQVELDIALNNLRIKRNRLLDETDYFALSDNTLSVEMKTYRQSLRDLTNGLTTVSQVNAVVWPIKP